MPQSHIYKYLRQSAKLALCHLSQLRPGRLVRFYKRWARSQDPTASPMKDEVPWMTFGAIEFLQRALREDMVVFEYGSGGSTLFFANRVRRLVTIEHDPEW